MTLYRQFQENFPEQTEDQGLPEEAWEVFDRIGYSIGYEEILCLRSLVLHLKDLQDQIDSLEQRLDKECHHH
jgi:hypothetical protein